VAALGPEVRGPGETNLGLESGVWSAGRDEPGFGVRHRSFRCTPVDGVIHDGKFLLEAFESLMFLTRHPDAPSRFAPAIAGRLPGSPSSSNRA